jgi:hypothetical protein
MKQLLLVVTIGVIILLSGCENPVDKKKPVEVPSWAQGIWYTGPNESDIKAAEITSSQYIAFQVSGYDLSYNPIVIELYRTDCTSVTNDMITFTGDLQVKKLSSADQISMGTQGIWITLYKRSNNTNEPNKPIEPTSYTVAYNANGGSGTMTNSSFTLNESQNLRTNTFTRFGNTFMGWAASSTGSVVYTDEQSVNNLASTAGATVTLYAVWSLTSSIDSYSSLADKLAWLQANAQSNTDYILEVSADENIRPASLSYSGKTNIGITLRGTDNERIIGLLSAGSLFTVGEGVTLTLNNNITLKGRNNNASLVRIDDSGILIMNAGSHINGNTSSSSYGGGVYVGNRGTFIMQSGKISGNSTSSSARSSSASATSGGGGVCVSGTFTMNGGEISGNTTTSESYSYSPSATSNGGGVYVQYGTFIMRGGKISGNTAISESINYTATSNGGGIYGGWSRTMTIAIYGGEISGNTATSKGRTSATSNGGGVFMSNSGANGGTFTMYDGEIFGNRAISSGYNSSTSTTSRGGGIYLPSFTTFRITNGIIYGSAEAANVRNTASSGGAAIYKTGDGIFNVTEYGKFTGSTWNPNGSLTTTNNTIQVVNGNLQ